MENVVDAVVYRLRNFPSIEFGKGFVWFVLDHNS